jgi:Flp pilus assembly protein TadG
MLQNESLPYVRAGRPVRRVRRGALMVELALSLPLFLTLAVGFLELGQATMVQQILTNAAREGARAGSLQGGTNTAVTTAVTQYLAAGNITSPSVTTTITPADLTTAHSGTTVTVAVAAPFDALSWLPVRWFLGGATLASQCAMRHE